MGRLLKGNDVVNVHEPGGERKGLQAMGGEADGNDIHAQTISMLLSDSISMVDGKKAVKTGKDVYRMREGIAAWKRSCGGD
ncbi:hypothetical protein DPPLL_00500 [Desulfofustis limnaeus]|uniref:Uncharacterized protein n=1 Tax=Desulfofustis limnaeus TaxID=2740163 RepID=A0ABN6LYJ8_9BACT|nr:hypothetical protein DPPLL_00500 [Desulfofustis limnaeus]